VYPRNIAWHIKTEATSSCLNVHNFIPISLKKCSTIVKKLTKHLILKQKENLSKLNYIAKRDNHNTQLSFMFL